MRLTEADDSCPCVRVKPEGRVDPNWTGVVVALSWPAVLSLWARTCEGHKKSAASTKKEVFIYICFSHASAETRTLHQHISALAPSTQEIIRND